MTKRPMNSFRTSVLVLSGLLSALPFAPMNEAKANPPLMAHPESEMLSALGIEGADELEELMEEGARLAQNSSRRRARAPRANKPKAGTKAAARKRPRRQADTRFSQARALAKAGKYQEASVLLFQMSRSPRYARESVQIKYVLGLMLQEMKMHQAAAFVFFDVIRQESRSRSKSKYLRQSLEKLAIAADSLDSDVLLRYAIKQVKESEFPAANRDMLYYRTGEIKLAEKDFASAARLFGRVRQGSIFYSRARYKQALALTEAGQLERAVAAFDDLAQVSGAGGVTDRNRVNALLGKARVLYQKKDFESSLEAYRQVPRDTEGWHDALFESSWAMVRDGRFRSALSNFHSLHSSYYDDVFQPESLLVRAIVYLYICRYDEMEKVLDLFSKTYKPVQRDVRNILNTVREPITYYRELAKVHENFDAYRSGERSRKTLQIPFVVARHILKEGDVKRTLSYLDKLNEEQRAMESMPANWRKSSVGQYAKKILEKRIESTHRLAGKQVRRHLISIQNQIRTFMEQDGLLRFEMLSSKREALRKEIAGKGLEKNTVDGDAERNYFIQNGYEYWPFKGEYWLDEIGNYHYVGVRACE